MRLRIHHVLLATFVGLGGLVVVMAFVIVESGLQRELRAIFRERITAQVERVAALTRSVEGADASALARSMRGTMPDRVTIIDTTGIVLGDSHVPAAALGEIENHGDRNEVLGAMTGLGTSVSFAERPSATVRGEAFLYGAMLSELNGEPVVVRVAAPLEHIDLAVGRVRRTVVLACAFAVVLALVPVAFLSRALAKPLEGFANKAVRLAEGRFIHGGPRSKIVELDRVGMAFNRLAADLRARLSDLERGRRETEALIESAAEGVIALSPNGTIMRSNQAARQMLDLPDSDDQTPFVGLVRNPDLREVAEEGLADGGNSAAAAGRREVEVGSRTLVVSARPMIGGGAVLNLHDISDIRRMEQVRRDFVANASHELRTPLTAIGGFVEALEADDPPPEVRAKFLSHISENTARLQRLIEDLLDLSRLEAGGWTAASEPVEVASAAADAWSIVSPRCGARDVSCSFEGDALVTGDQTALVNVFRNLLENAARHVDDEGRIEVRVLPPEPDGEGLITVEVRDDGEGIPASAIGRVFERFFRTDSSRARDSGGTGLGLSIVRHLVASMGGAVSAESELGKGTTIRFTLPAVEADTS